MLQVKMNPTQRRIREYHGMKMDHPSPNALIGTMKETMAEFANESPAVVSDWIAAVIDPQRPSAIQLLTDPTVELEKLVQAKDLYKLVRIFGHTPQVRRMGRRLYVASITAALVHHRVKISEQSEDTLSRAIHAFLRDPDMPDSIRSIMIRAAEDLPALSDVVIRVRPEVKSEKGGRFKIMPDLEIPLEEALVQKENLEREEETQNAVHESGKTLKIRRQRKGDPVFGHHYESMKGYCQTCRSEKEARRRLPHRKLQFWLTILTLGIWLPGWGILEMVYKLRGWRCIHCRRKVHLAIFA